MTAVIPEEHAPDACPACAAGVPCRVVTRGHARYWHLYRKDPARWGPVIRADAESDAGRPPAPAVRVRGSRPRPSPVDRHALYAALGRRERWKLPAGAGIVCAADSNAYPGLRLMLASVLLAHDAPVTVFDLGLTADQRAWLARQPVEVRTPALPEGVRFEPSRWALWVKPHLLAQSPHDVSIWLDSDLVVRRDLAPLAEAGAKGVAIFPDSFARPEILSNDPALYARYPVPEVFPSVNSGVIAYPRGHAFLARSIELLGEVIAGRLPTDWIRGWDQGLIKLALEELGARPIDDPSWNRPGWTLAEMRSRLTADEVLDRARPGEITHFQSEPKPWAGWAEYPLTLRKAPDLTVHVLGHEPFGRPKAPWLREVNLTDLDPDQSWGECRIYDHLDPDAIDTEYVGLATFSWLKKYDADGKLAPWEFGELELRPNVVWCAQRTDDTRFLPYPDWRDHIEHFNPGCGPLIDELRALSGRREGPVSAWSNNWVMHRDVFRGLSAFYRTWMRHFRETYPTCPYAALVPAKEWGYLGEAIGVHYLASRADLEFREMRWPRPARERAIACEHRGCPHGCGWTLCRRDHREVRIDDCIACKAGGAA